jgi:hypothetical protein
MRATETAMAFRSPSNTTRNHSGVKSGTICAGLFPAIEASISVLHREWCNLIFLEEGLEKRAVFRATIKPV